MEESELRNTAPEYDPKPCPLCGKPMRCGLLQSGGVLYFTDKEKYWINWPLKSRGDIPLLGSSFRPSRMTARRSSPRSARTARLFCSTTARSGTTGAGIDKNCRESP